MNMDFKNIKAYDWDYEIVFSNNYIIYENKLTFKWIYGFDVILNFITDKNIKHSPIERKYDEKNIIINLTNFNNVAWTWATKKLVILEKIDWNKQLSISLHWESLIETLTFMRVAVTFYLK